MENYEKFVEFHLSQLKKTKNANFEEKPKSSSLIFFHGRPILPPVLSEPQREEMGKLREAAQRKCKDDSRLSYVQTILHNVHIRKTPTLEELLKESDVYAQALSCDTISGSVSENILTKEGLPHLFKPTETVKEIHHPLTSTTCSVFLASQVQTQTCHSDNSHSFYQAGHSGLNSCSPFAYCQQSLSSGYDSYMNVENNVQGTGSLKPENGLLEKRGDNDEDFFDHDSSDTVRRMPDIINYPPIDGEELERSGHESAFVTDLKAGNPKSASFVEPGSAEESCIFPKSTETLCLEDESDSPQDIEAEWDLIEQPKDAPISFCLTQIDTQHAEMMQTDEEDLKPTEDPYRMSLQTLLKKSQEYRRHQRMLRSQSKNSKIQGRAQDQPKSEEHGLSDKENDEWHSKGTPLNKSQERSDTLSLTVNQSLKRSNENDGKSEESFDKFSLPTDSEAQNSIMTLNSDSYDSIKINNWVNTNGSKSVSLSVPKRIKNLNKSSEHCANTSPTAFKDVGKYRNIPAPYLCKSPISHKVKRPSPPFDKISPKDTSVNNSMNKKNKDELTICSISPLNVTVESDVTSVLAKSSLHIDQLEFNLSGLKVLISDLESTLTENVDKSSSQSESQQIQSSQNDLVGWFDDVRQSQNILLLDRIKSDKDKTLQTEQVIETINPQEEMMTSKAKEDAQKPRRPSSAIQSATQRMLIPDVFRICLPEATTQNYVSALSDTSNCPVMPKFDPDMSQDSRSTSLNQSYDVEAPSELWFQRECGPRRCDNSELTPESGNEGQGMRSKVKRRLQMTADVQEKGHKEECSMSRPSSSTPKAAARWHEGLNSVKERQEQLKQIHAAQIRALQEEHRRQQEQLLQASKARYRLLRGASLPHSTSTSRLGDTVTFPTLTQQPSAGPLPEHHRHLLSAAAKGFLTRRLLKTERVAQLVRTVRDTQQFLKAFQLQSPNTAFWSKQDQMLHERVTLQLRAARYEIYDIFFSLTAGERMQLISIDRDLARERELRRQNGVGGQPKGKSSLSAATQRSLERKRGLIIQKKTVERHRGAGMRTRHKPGFSAEQPLETRAGQFRANPQRVPKSTYTSRPR